MNLLFTVLRNKTPFTTSKTLIIRNLMKLHNPRVGQVPPIGAILFFGIWDLVFFEAANYSSCPVKKYFVVQKLELWRCELKS